jgi:hypothetical protein
MMPQELLQPCLRFTVDQIIALAARIPDLLFN